MIISSKKELKGWKERMDRESFYVGLSMLLAPFLFFFVYCLIQAQIDWKLIGLVILEIAYSIGAYHK